MPATELAPLHVALLRGINVSGKNTLPMAELTSIFVQAGCKDVRTYIQSGNVVFRAKASVARRVPEVVAGAIAEGFGYEVPVVCRSASEFRKVAKGLGRSKLTNKYFDSKLGTTSTLRNWKTVLRLAAMLDD
jgi:uncharacterized protein (DUF1697 family)